MFQRIYLWDGVPDQGFVNSNFNKLFIFHRSLTVSYQCDNTSLRSIASKCRSHSSFLAFFDGVSITNGSF